VSDRQQVPGQITAAGVNAVLVAPQFADPMDQIDNSRTKQLQIEHDGQKSTGQSQGDVLLHGAVIGGGLELAAAAHIRIAERSAYYALPEGARGIFVGGGGAVRIPRLIGTTRMIDMMLTGRTYSAEEGLSLGFSQYVVDDGHGLAKAIELAERISTNTVLSNFAMVQALPRIARSDPDGGFLLESLMAAITIGGDEAKARINAFLEKRVPKVAPLAGESERQ
jgi:enoyl-CoA hydratase/carnithine racemase